MKENKKDLEGLKKQKVETDQVNGGRTQPFNEFVERKQDVPANVMSEERASAKKSLGANGGRTKFSKRNDAKK